MGQYIELEIRKIRIIFLSINHFKKIKQVNISIVKHYHGITVDVFYEDDLDALKNMKYLCKDIFNPGRSRTEKLLIVLLL